MRGRNALASGVGIGLLTGACYFGIEFSPLGEGYQSKAADVEACAKVLDNPNRTADDLKRLCLVGSFSLKQHTESQRIETGEAISNTGSHILVTTDITLQSGDVYSAQNLPNARAADAHHTRGVIAEAAVFGVVATGLSAGSLYFLGSSAPSRPH